MSRSVSTWRCPVCLTPLGTITRAGRDADRYFTARPGIVVIQRPDCRFEVVCACGHLHRFVGADPVIRFRIVQ